MLDITYKDTWITRIDSLNGMTYIEYLNSDEWKIIKKKAAKRKFYSKCLKCGSNDGISLHHRSYKWLGTKQAMRGIVPVCQKHHDEIHQLAKDKNISVRLATNEYLKEYYEQFFKGKGISKQ